MVNIKPSSTNSQDVGRHILHDLGDTKKAAELLANAQKLADKNPALTRAVKAYGSNISSTRNYQAAQAQIKKAVDTSPYWKTQTPKQREEGIKNYTAALLGGGPGAGAQNLADSNPAAKRAILDYGRSLHQGTPSPEKYKTAADQIALAVADSPYFKKQGAAVIKEATKKYTALLLGDPPRKGRQVTS